ncbi:MAG TPA: type II toxin-antitoxin system VapC family toxin [Polyangia bacterium]|nr:type II toxin-antitoxin system VapC family toxin [Polyangia bacterium]
MKLLLDTCTFLWMALGERALSRGAREAITDPANDVYLSAISSWEIALKHALGKLPLPEQPTLLLPEMRARLHVEALALEEPAALAIAQLPELHRDPFDRMLICQAIMGGLTLVTPDPLVRQYAVPTLW